MKHFTIEDEIDFVNQVVPTTRKVAMERHLKDCGRCAKAVSQWQRARQCAAAESNYQPPQEAVRIAKAAFAGLQLAMHRKPAGGSIELVFDSFLHAQAEGFRSAGSATRQMVYRADPFQIDLHIELQPGDKRVVVTGQLLGLRDPQIVGENVGLILANLCGRLVRTVTNQFGEFRAEIENSGDLALVFFKTDHKPVVIPLQDALSRPSDAARKRPSR
jgi:predicted anti-sigma-YlaC factor YlaD